MSSDFLTGSIQTITFGSGSPAEQIPVGNNIHDNSAAAGCKLLIRAENDGIWIGKLSSASNFPADKANMFRLINGKEYTFTFPKASLGDTDPNLYARTDSTSTVTLSFVLIYGG